MRALGVDVGTVRVGLAVCDPSGLVATPLDTLEAGPGSDRDPSAWARDLAVRLASVARIQGCETVVVGLPRALSGADTASTRLVRQVADEVGAQGLPVVTWDERFSSVEAERRLLGAGRRRAQRRVERDQVAATIVLQGWLDSRRQHGEPEHVQGERTQGEPEHVQGERTQGEPEHVQGERTQRGDRQWD